MENQETAAIKNCQNGQFDDFAWLYDQYIKKIYDFIYYKTFHKETAEDLTSQTFIKALDNINTYKAEKGNFGAWLYRIAANTVIDHFRTRKNEKNIDDIFDLGDEVDYELDIDNQEKLKQVKKYLQQLKPQQRDIVILRLWQELSYQEIAAITNLSEANCKMIYSRTIKLLKQKMPATTFLLFLLFKLINQ